MEGRRSLGAPAHPLATLGEPRYPFEALYDLADVVVDVAQV
jgi:hypothetical protein